MIERRQITELRTSGRKLTGYAVKFDTEARIGSFTETIRAGAFSESLASGRDVAALVDHDATKLLARMKTGNLKLTEDAHGLAFELNLPETTAGADVLALAQRSELGGMSIGFLVGAGGESWAGNKRILTRLDLHEISVVTGAMPAYEGTTVHPRIQTPRLNVASRYMETLWGS